MVSDAFAIGCLVWRVFGEDGASASAPLSRYRYFLSAAVTSFFPPLPQTATKSLQAIMKYVLVSGGVISGVGKVSRRISGSLLAFDH